MKEFACPRCQEKVGYADDANLHEVLVAHAATCPVPAATTPKTPKNVVDLVPKEVLDGNLLSMDDIINTPVLVTAMSWRESSFKEDTNYLQLEIELDGKKSILNTGAERIIRAFEYIKKEDLPMFATFEKVTTRNNRRVYKIAGDNGKV